MICFEIKGKTRASISNTEVKLRFAGLKEWDVRIDGVPMVFQYRHQRYAAIKLLEHATCNGSGYVVNSTDTRLDFNPKTTGIKLSKDGSYRKVINHYLNGEPTHA